MPLTVRRDLPNIITVLRLVLAGLFFASIEILDRHQASDAAGLASALESRAVVGAWAMGLFATAALSDILDGYLARRWNVVSTFGRLMDPLVDKILLLGGFIYLASPVFKAYPDQGVIGSGIAAWMVVTILLRELLVTGLRSYFEALGVPFPADWSGKLKMFVQSFCVGCCVYVGTRIEPFGWQVFLRDASTWATVVLTVLSSITYIQRAMRIAVPSGSASATRAGEAEQGSCRGARS